MNVSFSYRRGLPVEKTGDGGSTDENMNFWGFGIYMSKAKKEMP